MSKEKWKVSIKNMGGLKELDFSISPGLTVIKSPNAVGKSSITYALQAFCINSLSKDKKDRFLRRILNETSTKGSVTLSNGSQYRVVLTKTPQGNISMKVTEFPWNSDKAFELGFCLPDSRLVQILNSGRHKEFESWFKDVSDVVYYHSAVEILDSMVDEKEREKINLKRQMSKDPTEIENEIAEIEQNINDLEEQNLMISQQLSEMGYEEEEKKRREINKQVQEKETELSQIESKVTTMVSQLNRDEEEKKDISDEIKDHTREMKELSNRLSEVKSRKGFITQRFDEIEHLRIDLSNSIKEREKKVKKWNETLSTDTSVCSACGNKYDSDVLKSASQKLEKMVQEDQEDLRKIREEKDALTQEKRQLDNQEARVKQIRDLIEEKNTKLKTLKNKIKKSKDELSNTENLRDNVKNEYSNLVKESEELVKPRTDKAEELNKNLNMNSGEIRAYSERKRQLDKQLIELVESSKKYKNNNAILEELRKLDNYLRERYDYLMHGVRVKINDYLTQAIKLLEYKSFQTIQILDDYSLRLIREDGTLTELDRLSASERLTIALLITFAAKQSYAESFPIFVVDEIMGSFDRTRFERILKYIEEHVDYLMVTTLVPLEEQREISVSNVLN